MDLVAISLDVLLVALSIIAVSSSLLVARLCVNGIAWLKRDNERMRLEHKHKMELEEVKHQAQITEHLEREQREISRRIGRVQREY